VETGGKVANLLLKTALGAGCRRKYPKNSIETQDKRGQAGEEKQRHHV